MGNELREYKSDCLLDVSSWWIFQQGFHCLLDVCIWCMYDSMLLVLIVWHRSSIWLKNGILGFVGDGYVTNLCKRVLEGF
jgi:hypothetical protein